jgi:hypothetical protein
MVALPDQQHQPGHQSQWNHQYRDTRRYYRSQSSASSDGVAVYIEDDHDMEDISTLTDDATSLETRDGLYSAYTHWPCPQCTLHNPWHTWGCGACDYRRSPPAKESTWVPSPDTVLEEEDARYREDDEGLYSRADSVSFSSAGAVLGGVMGAASAYLRDRSHLLGSATLQGAVTGAIGGALLDTVWNQDLAALASLGLPSSSCGESVGEVSQESQGSRRSQRERERVEETPLRVGARRETRDTRRYQYAQPTTAAAAASIVRELQAAAPDGRADDPMFSSALESLLTQRRRGGGT